MVSRKRRPRNRRFSELAGMLISNMRKRKTEVWYPKRPSLWMKSKGETREGRRERRRSLKGKRSQRRDVQGGNQDGGGSERLEKVREPRSRDWSIERKDRGEEWRWAERPGVPAGTPLGAPSQGRKRAFLKEAFTSFLLYSHFPKGISERGKACRLRWTPKV